MAAPPWLPNGVGGWLPASGSVHARLLGFVKTALLRQLVTPDSLVCDLFCGRGTDTGRWAEAGIGRYIGVDLTGSALEEAREQWEKHNKPFPAEFSMLNPCMVDLGNHLVNKGLPADVVSCFAHLQDCFTSEEIVRRLLKNVETILKPGGFFFGTVPDSSTIWYKYQKAVQEAMKAGSLRVNGTLPSIRTEMYKLTFDDDRFHTFGSKYHMRYVDDGLPAQPQLLVHFPSLIKLAKEVGLECLEIQNLLEFYDDHSGPFSDVLRSSCENQGDQKGLPVLDQRNRLNSQALDVLSLYTTFVFKKEESDGTTPLIYPTLEPMFKTSRSVEKDPVDFSPELPESSGLRTFHRAKAEASSPSPSRKSPATKFSIEQREDLYRLIMQEDTINVDPDVEPSKRSKHVKLESYHDGVLEAMQDTASSDLIREKTTSDLDNNATIQLSGSIGEDHESRPCNWMSGRSALEGAATGSGDYPTRDPMSDLVVEGNDPRSLPSSDESGARSWRDAQESLKQVPSGWEFRPPRGFSTAKSVSVKSESTNVVDSGYARNPPAVAQRVKTLGYTGERLDETNAAELQGRALENYSPISSRRMANDVANRDDENHYDHQAVIDPGPRHYTRREHDGISLDETSRTARRQDMTPGDHDSQHYRRRSRDNRDGRKKRETLQGTQSSPGDSGDSKHRQQRKDHNNHHQAAVKKPEPFEKHTPSVVVTNRTSLHYERRMHESVGDRSSVAKQASMALDRPSNRSSKHYLQRSQENSEFVGKDESHDERGGAQNKKAKWAGSKSSSHVESRRV